MSTQRKPDQPNLLFLYSDQHSASVLGCYGDPLVQTPHLDGLAGKGVIFEQAYSPSPLCGPSRMSLLTGRFPHENRVWTNEHILDSSIPTYAHAWGAAGYRPVLIGRLHSVGNDQLRGYAERQVGDHYPNYLSGRRVDRGLLDGAQDPGRVSLTRSGPGLNAYQVHDQDVTDAAVRFLNEEGAKRQSGADSEPFCLTVGLMLPHQPYVAERRDFELYKDRVSLPHHPEPFTDALHPHHRRWRTMHGIEAVSDEETLRARAAYWGMVTRLDAMIGEIVSALEANDLAENTVIVYLSDHGDHVGEHGLWWKQSFYEESARVPAIVVWPGVMPAGARCRRVISSMDVSATMIAALGGEPLPGSHGRDLRTLFADTAGVDSEPAWDDVAFAEYCTDEGWYQRMVRSGEWKLCYYHGEPPQLFNMTQDPYEMTNRADDPDCRDVLEELTALALRDWDPVDIERTMKAKQAELRMIKAWAENVEPPDQYRWEMTADMNRLDEMGA